MCLLALVLATWPACEAKSPERILRPPIIRSYSPQQPHLDVFVGETLSFSVRAVDPANEKLEYYFTLDGKVVAVGPVWEYAVDDTGSVEVLAHASNGATESTVGWTIDRTRPENEPPVVTSASPPDPNPIITVKTPVSFSMTALDPEGAPLSYWFTVNDSFVSGSNRYTYPSPRIGQFRIKAFAWDGSETNGNVNFEWLLTVRAEPDSLPPAPVVLRSLVTGAETGELTVEWIAVGNDGMDGLPSHYVVRTSSIEIKDLHSWGTASDRPGAPAPAAPGEIQRMVIRDLNPANLVYVAVRAADDFGNLSPLANSLGAVVKGNDVHVTVRNAITAEPVPGIHARWIGIEHVTGPDGTFSWTSLPDGAGRIQIWDEDDPADYGAYFDMLTDARVIRDEDSIIFWVIPNVQLQTSYYASFLHFVKLLTNPGGTYGDLLRNWIIPVDVYVPPFMKNGLDYERVIKDGLTEWESLTGFDLFRFVDAPPAYGFSFTYSSTASREIYEVLESDSRQLTIRGRITIRTHYDPSTEPVLHSITNHEIGHAIGFAAHSVDPGHLMIGGQSQAVSAPTLDEIWLTEVLYHLPIAQSMSWYLFD